MPITHTIVAGIDVGKSGLDAHLEPSHQARHFANTKPGRRALRNWLVQHGATRAVLEPTGRYHRELHQCLFDSGLETVLVNRLRSRRFAEAIGRLAKNDRVDASMLACYGLLDGLVQTPPKPANLCCLNDLLAIRRKHAQHRTAQLKLHAQLADDTASELGAPAIALFDKLIKQADAAIQACLAADATLARRAAILRSVPGLGSVNAASLCADVPELGSIDRRQAAALIGVAPFDRDSGQLCGARHIHGGREHPRKLLYMAATAAIRCNPAMQACFQRLRANGKEHKVAMVAVMRKLVTLVNSVLHPAAVPRHSPTPAKIASEPFPPPIELDNQHGSYPSYLRCPRKQGHSKEVAQQGPTAAAPRRKARHKGMQTAIFATVRKLATLVYRMLHWD